MSDWNVGDLAVCISETPLCPFCESDGDIRMRLGTVATVCNVFPPGYPDEPPGLDFVEAPVGDDECWCACAFRKIDKPEACEEEFTVLLKRSRKAVRA